MDHFRYLLVAETTKKRHPIWKSYLEAFYGLLDVRNVESYLELLYSYTHNVFQLLLSFEIDPSEASGVDFIEISHQIERWTTIEKSGSEQKSEHLHSISRSSVNRWSSYSTVL